MLVSRTILYQRENKKRFLKVAPSFIKDAKKL